MSWFAIEGDRDPVGLPSDFPMPCGWGWVIVNARRNLEAGLDLEPPVHEQKKQAQRDNDKDDAKLCGIAQAVPTRATR